MKLRTLLECKAVLTQEEVAAALGEDDKARRRTRHSLLRYYQKTGRLVRARRGLYVVVPADTVPEKCPVDPYLLAAKAAADAVLAYHTALDVHGRAYSSFRRIHYLSRRQQRPWRFRDHSFHRVAFPKALVRRGQQNYDVQTSQRAAEPVRVTSLERTLVDVLHRPEIAGGYEEVWRSLESVEFYNLDRVVEYALLLGNATTVAKVGFFLEQHREELMVEDRYLDMLREHRPKRPHYFRRGTKHEVRFVTRWNLVVPRQIFDRSWEQVR